MKENILNDTYQIDTETILHEDGRVDGFTASYEQGHNVLADGKEQASSRGRMKYFDNGNYAYKPYQQGTRIPAEPILNGEKGQIFENRHQMVIRIVLPKSLGYNGLRKAFRQEYLRMQHFLLTCPVADCPFGRHHACCHCPRACSLKPVAQTVQ